MVEDNILIRLMKLSHPKTSIEENYGRIQIQSLKRGGNEIDVEMARSSSRFIFMTYIVFKNKDKYIQIIEK